MQRPLLVIWWNAAAAGATAAQLMPQFSCSWTFADLAATDGLIDSCCAPPAEGRARAAGRPVPGARQQAKEEEGEEGQREEEGQRQGQRKQRQTGGGEETQGRRPAAQAGQSEEATC